MIKNTFIIAAVCVLVGVPLLCKGVPQEATVGFDYGDERLIDMLDTCLDAQKHKSKPGPEDSLHLECAPWANRSCCTPQTSSELHYQKSYNFDWNHCSHIKSLSENCSKHFRQDLCFYECSPNVGPWKVQVDMKIRKERFYKIPLCESDCKTWFEDCEDDYTCTDNWTVNMEWKKGEGNRCPRGSSCKTFKQIYRTPKYFCETVWDHSWEVVSDHDHCMRLWFNPSGGNPNDDVARWKAIQIIQDKNRRSVGTSVTPIAFQERAKVAIIIATSVLFTTLGVQNVFLG